MRHCAKFAGKPNSYVPLSFGLLTQNYDDSNPKTDRAGCKRRKKETKSLSRQKQTKNIDRGKTNTEPTQGMNNKNDVSIKVVIQKILNYASRNKPNKTNRPAPEATGLCNTPNVADSPPWSAFSTVKNSIKSGSNEAEKKEHVNSGSRQSRPGGSKSDAERKTKSVSIGKPETLMTERERRLQLFASRLESSSTVFSTASVVSVNTVSDTFADLIDRWVSEESILEHLPPNVATSI